jgi:anthranilate synthase component 1
MFSELVIFDHLDGTLQLVSNIFIDDRTDIDEAYLDAVAAIGRLRTGLSKPIEPFIAELNRAEPNFEARTAKTDFMASVEKAREYIKVGDVFQVVISQRFDASVTASALDVYRVLRSLNPSPYMYLLNLSDESGPFTVVGASPEALVTVQQGRVVTHPIAGSRPRGRSLEEDVELGESLQKDDKERAEHLMLVDLARNDLLKVCKPESLRVSEFMQLHRYSHVMHLVSTVEGELAAELSPVDAFRATFPAGTLSGAPKPRALEIIDELEPAGRGGYGGVVGYFDFSGNADLAIAIRTAFIRDGIARVQAGAGLVLDSIAESEWQECLNKASAPLRAVAIANAMQRLG